MIDPGAPVSWRPLRREDFGLLAGWLDDPEVARWWPDPHRPEDLERHYGPRLAGLDRTEVFIVEVGGIPCGLIQRYRIAEEEEWRRALTATAAVPELGASAGIDYLLGRPDARHRGLGTRLIEAFTAAIWEEMPGIDAVVVAVQAANRASWRALERAGYERVWSGMLASADPSDAGPAVVLRRGRPG